jgi:hypothetical protein
MTSTDQTFEKEDGTIVKVDSFDLSQFQFSYKDLDDDLVVAQKLGTEPEEKEADDDGDVSSKGNPALIRIIATAAPMVWDIMKDSKPILKDLQVHVLPPGSRRGHWSMGQMTRIRGQVFAIDNMFGVEHCKFSVTLDICKDGQLNTDQPTPQGEWMTDIKTAISVKKALVGTKVWGDSKILQKDGVPIVDGKPKFQIETTVYVKIWGQTMRYRLTYSMHGHSLIDIAISQPW